jgi:hypothetical protein
MVVVKSCTDANADGAQAWAEFLSELSIIEWEMRRVLLVGLACSSPKPALRLGCAAWF